MMYIQEENIYFGIYSADQKDLFDEDLKIREFPSLLAFK